MKSQLNRLAGRRAFRLGVPLTTTLLLLAALPVAAANTPYTATGWVIGVPVPGLWCTNALGQVGFRGNAHLARVVGTDPRLTGRRTIFVDGAAQADGSSIIYGPVYHEVGTWDEAGTNFTPTGGMWETTYRGTMGTDGSLQLHVVGSGWGGTVDGLRLDETLTRAAGAILDPAIPYQYTGTIKPAPVSTVTIIDDFEDGKVTGWSPGCNSGSIDAVEANGQFILRGNWPGTQTVSGADTSGWAAQPFNWTAKDNETLELRADLIGISDAATEAQVKLKRWPACYGFSRSQRYVALWKFVPGWPITVFTFEPLTLANTNATLVLALTDRGQDLMVTGRVLDKANHDAVLYERSVVDTPNADPTLSTDELEEQSGMRILLAPDRAEPPLRTFDHICLALLQYTDGQLPPVEVTFDNCEIRRYSSPSLSIANAVRLTWPAVAAPYAVEGAPTVTGPWFPVLEPVFESGNMKQVTVPTKDAMRFWRLQQAP